MSNRNAIRADSWDRQDLSEAAKDKGFARARRQANKMATTGADAVNDAFFALMKADPQLVPLDDLPYSHWVNRVVAKEMLDLPSTRRLRGFTVGDLVASTQAVEQLAPSLEAIFDRLHLEQAQAQELQELLVVLFIRTTLRDSMNHLANELEHQSELARAWGLESGALRKMDAQVRMELARRLNTPRMRSIAELFGRIEALSFSPPQHVDHRHEEVYDVEMGGDIGRVLPSELLLLGEPGSEDVFLAKLADRELLQYAVRAEDELGRGTIIYCCDSSGSMTGERELWSKAVMLVLLHLCRSQKRSMHVIHFGTVGEFWSHSFEKPEDFSAERILEAAEFFLGGGTDYVTPLNVALEFLATEFNATGRTSADVVFATDAECGLTEIYTKCYLAEMERLGSRTWGIYIAGGPVPDYGALHDITEGRVMTVSDLQSGQEISALLQGLR